MNKTLSKTKEELSPKEIEQMFKDIKPAERLFAPAPDVIPENKNIVDDWIIAGGSSKPNNKFVEVSTWQTGQAY